MDDLPPELLTESEEEKDTSVINNWEQALATYADQCLENGENRIMDRLTPRYETILIEAGLRKTHGKKKEAAELLGLGRNTLTRKLAELDIKNY
jgi:two-component system nitrogen regulation response regulator GlnG